MTHEKKFYLICFQNFALESNYEKFVYYGSTRKNTSERRFHIFPHVGSTEKILFCFLMCEPQDIFSKNGMVYARITSLNVSKNPPYFSLIGKRRHDLV